MKFLLVEDDFLQGDATCNALKSGFPGAHVELITTERELYDAIDSLASDPPAVAIMDIKLPWEDAREDHTPAPEHVLVEGDRRAGLRCWEQMSQRGGLQSVRAVFFSHILDEELEKEIQERFPGAFCLRKSQSSTRLRSVYDPLIQLIRSILDTEAS